MLSLLIAAATAAPGVHGVESTTPADQPSDETSAFCPAPNTKVMSGGVTLTGQPDGAGLQSAEADGGITFRVGWYGAAWRLPSVTGPAWGIETSAACVNLPGDALLQRRRVNVSTTNPNGSVSVRCPFGYSAISGHFRTGASLSPRAIAVSAPSGDITWTGAWVDMTPTIAESVTMYPEVAVWCLPNAIYTARIVRVVDTSPGPGAASAMAVCPPGSQVVGGGAAVVPQLPGVVLTATAPDVVGGPGTAWIASAHEVGPPGAPWVVKATAICLLP